MDSARATAYTSCMNRRFVIVSAIALACSRASGQMPATVAVANDPLLQHHEIRIDQLPKPYATPSSGNPPSVSAPPANATLHVPPGFHVSLFADKLGQPRAMLLAPNGDVILSEPGEGKITILRDANHDGVAEQRFTFASGLDSPYGLALEPVTGALWTAVNERDGLGDELVPDYATAVTPGAFYGWPYAYMGPNEDPRRAGEHPDLVRKTIPPSVPIQSHSAPLGIVFY